MKVLLVSEYFPPKVQGGGEISAYLLAKNLVKQGIRVHILTSKFDNQEEFEYNEDGIKIHRLLLTGEPNSFCGNMDRALSFDDSISSNKVKFFLHFHNFNIIHSMNSTSLPGVSRLEGKKVAHINSPVPFCPKGNLIYKGEECKGKCNLMKCMLSSREIGKMKNSFYLKYNPVFWWYLKAKQKALQNSLKHFDHIFPTSTHLKNKLIETGITKDKITILPNIVETEKFGYKKTNGKKLKILYLGAYIKSKGVWDLLLALQGVNFKYQCNFYGEGLLKQELKNYVEHYKLNVKINDKTNNIQKVINKHDVVVMPSIVPEAFGRIAIETMASGKIIIGRDRGGLKDIITDNKTGFLFDDVNELRELLGMISRNNIINKNVVMKEAQEYEGEKIAKKAIKVYKKILKCQTK